MSGKEENKSEVFSSSSSAVRMGIKEVNSKIPDVTFQERLNKIKAEKS